MDDEGTEELPGGDPWVAEIQRAVLSETEEGRTISAGFIACFGVFVSDTVRPILRDVAAAGGEPQLLVNGLAEMLRSVADSVEFPLGADSSPRRPTAADDVAPDGVSSDPVDPS